MNDAYEYVGTELDLFAAARRWKHYIKRQLGPYVGRHVLEVGAGLGATTRALCRESAESWTCVEPDRSLASRLEVELDDARRALDPRPFVLVGTTADIPARRAYDTILYVDVLEHIEQDATELRNSARLLRDDGYLVIVAPAHPWLFSPFDEAIGHFRRYNRRSLAAVIPDELRRVALRYLDSVGMIASLGNRFSLRARMPTPRQLAIWDRIMVPCSRMLDPLTGYRLGKTILGVWQR